MTVLRLSRGTHCIGGAGKVEGGGEVCLHVKNNLLVNTRDDIAYESREEVESFTLPFSSRGRNKKEIVGLCYRPPNMKDEETDLLLQLEMAVR